MRESGRLPRHVEESLARALVLTQPDCWAVPPAALLLRARIAWDAGDEGGLPCLDRLSHEQAAGVTSRAGLMAAREMKRERGPTAHEDALANRPLWIVAAVAPPLARVPGDFSHVYPVTWRASEVPAWTAWFATELARRFAARDDVFGMADHLMPPASPHGRWEQSLAFCEPDDVELLQERSPGWAINTHFVNDALGLQDCPCRDDILLRSDVETWLYWLDVSLADGGGSLEGVRRGSPNQCDPSSARPSRSW